MGLRTLEPKKFDFPIDKYAHAQDEKVLLKPFKYVAITKLFKRI